MPGISAIIPTFNRARLLPRAIESVLTQTLPPDQVIIVDDGSTDDTREVCARYDGRIEYVRQENAGASAARNSGIARARHRWLAFLDSDDYWERSHIDALVAAITATLGEAAVYFSDMQMPEEEGGGTLWQRIGFQPVGPFHLVRDATAWALMKRQPIMLQAAIINKEKLEQIGGFDVRFRLSHDTFSLCQLTIGGVACAVAGVGCVQTADDTSPARLSTEIPLGSVAKARESCCIWSDVLRDARGLSPAFHRLVRYNAAGSQWQVGMSLIKSGTVREGIVRLLRAAAIDPRFALWLVRHGTARGYEQTVRSACPQVNGGLPPTERRRSERNRAWKRGTAL